MRIENFGYAGLLKKMAAAMAAALMIIPANAQSPADSILHFIKNNKSRSSLYLVQNDSVLARQNENMLMPLASTVKIMVAIEFAKQAGKKVIDEKSLVPLKELDKYYLFNTDGGAHPAWLQFEKKQNHIVNDSIPLIDVARGMILFSSNANTEYLMDLLGMDNVKNNIQLLGLKKHTALYPVVASLFMYQNPKRLKEEKIIKGIKALDEEHYCRYIFDMHNALKYDTVLKASFNPFDLSMNMQKLWSNRLTASTTKEYAHIGSILNRRKYFDQATYAILSLVLESVMENPANKNWLKHAGMKGGSTAFVLTKALYATTQKEEKIEMAYFFNDLTQAENSKLQKWMNAFELSVLSKPEFRDRIRTLFLKE
ncbi:MAG: serine hydrolase [Ferruginibacter sp.]